MSNKNIPAPLDEQLLSAEAFAPLPNALFSMQFKSVTLNTQVGEYEKGTKFPFAVLLGDASALILIDENQEEHAFKLNVSVGEAINAEDLHADGCGDESCEHDH